MDNTLELLYILLGDITDLYKIESHRFCDKMSFYASLMKSSAKTIKAEQSTLSNSASRFLSSMIAVALETQCIAPYGSLCRSFEVTQHLASIINCN